MFIDKNHASNFFHFFLFLISNKKWFFLYVIFLPLVDLLSLTLLFPFFMISYTQYFFSCNFLFLRSFLVSYILGCFWCLNITKFWKMCTYYVSNMFVRDYIYYFIMLAWKMEQHQHFYIIIYIMECMLGLWNIFVRCESMCVCVCEWMPVYINYVKLIYQNY